MASDSSLAASLAFPLGWRALGLSASEEAAFELFLSLWPPGAWHELYDVDNPQSGVAQWFAALAEAFAYGTTEPADRLRRELDIREADERLDGWERALALPITPAAPTTVEGRRAVVIAKLRESGGTLSRADLRAVLGPLLGYADPTVLQIFESNRAALRGLHTYSGPPAGVHIGPAGGTATQTAYCSDDGAVSVGGVILTLPAFVTDQTMILLTLSAPDGTSASFGADGQLAAASLTIRTTRFNGAALFGAWTLTAFVAAGSIDFDPWTIFVEGVGRDSAGTDGRGAENFHLAVYADPALEAAMGASDRAAARFEFVRIRPAHATSTLVPTLVAVPGALLPAQIMPSP